MHIFKEVSFIKLHTTEKQTINSTYLVSVGCWRLANEKGTRLTRRSSQSCSCPFPSGSLIQLIQVDLFVFLVLLKKEDCLENLPFCPVSSTQKHSFNLLCALDNISLNSHISTDLNNKTMQQKVTEFSPFIRS